MHAPFASKTEPPQVFGNPHQAQLSLYLAAAGDDTRSQPESFRSVGSIMETASSTHISQSASGVELRTPATRPSRLSNGNDGAESPMVTFSSPATFSSSPTLEEDQWPDQPLLLESASKNVTRANHLEEWSGHIENERKNDGAPGISGMEAEDASNSDVHLLMSTGP